MEMIFKKYHKSEQHRERNYLIYDPSHNHVQFTSDLCKAISHRNFVQNCENILVGPIINGQDMSMMVLTADGMEVSSDPETDRIFRTYLKDQGYFSPDRIDKNQEEDIQAFGTVYYFPA